MTSPFVTLVPTVSVRGSSERWRKIAFRCGAPASVTSRLLPFPRKNQFFRVMVPSNVAFTGVPTGVLKSTPLCFRPSFRSEVICSQLSSGEGSSRSSRSLPSAS